MFVDRTIAASHALMREGVARAWAALEDATAFDVRRRALADLDVEALTALGLGADVEAGERAAHIEALRRHTT